MSTLLRSGLAGMLLVAMTVANASAQCSTCATPTVAYSPVVAQPVVAQPTVAYRPYNGWYPGKLLDQWRLRRAGVGTTATAYTATPAPTYTAAYAPSYTASYAPTYTTSYAPVSYTASYAPTYTAAYRPYVTSFAPLSSAAATGGCSTCTQTVARPVLMRPVVAPACDVCSYSASPCGCTSGCDACSSGVSQAVYSDSSSGCSSCAAGGTVTSVVPPTNPSTPSVGPATTQPSFNQVPEAAPPQSDYRSNRAPLGSGSRESSESDIDPLDAHDPLESDFPGPDVTPDADSSTWYHNAPQLLDPRNNTAVRSYKSRQPTVDVRTAIYRNESNRPVQPRVSQTSGRRVRTQAEIDADGWSSVPSGR